VADRRCGGDEGRRRRAERLRTEERAAPTMRRMTRPALLLLTAVALSVPVVAPAHGAAPKKPNECTRKKADKKRERRCEGRGGPLAARFRLVDVDVKGTISVAQRTDHVFTAEGTSRYARRGTLSGKAFKIAAHRPRRR
jgi:hypothetical protein